MKSRLMATSVASFFCSSSACFSPVMSIRAPITYRRWPSPVSTRPRLRHQRKLPSGCEIRNSIWWTPGWRKRRSRVATTPSRSSGWISASISAALRSCATGSRPLSTAAPLERLNTKESRSTSHTPNPAVFSASASRSLLSRSSCSAVKRSIALAASCAPASTVRRSPGWGTAGFR